MDSAQSIGAARGSNTKIVPGHGPVVGREESDRRTETWYCGVRDRVAQLIAQGKSQDEVVTAHPTADFDAKVANSMQRREGFVMQVYAELKSAK